MRRRLIWIAIALLAICAAVFVVSRISIGDPPPRGASER